MALFRLLAVALCCPFASRHSFVKATLTNDSVKNFTTTLTKSAAPGATEITVAAAVNFAHRLRLSYGGVRIENGAEFEVNRVRSLKWTKFGASDTLNLAKALTRAYPIGSIVRLYIPPVLGASSTLTSTTTI